MKPTRTKIVCTMGPAIFSKEKIEELLLAGMNVARLNFSHGTREEHIQTIENLKASRKKLSYPLALMFDMQGPKIRVGALPEEGLILEPKQKIRLVEQGKGTFEEIPFHPFEILFCLKEGMKVLFDDGYITARVLSVDSKGVWLEVENRGLLKSGKGVNIPNADLPLPAMTEKDFEDLRFGIEHGVDFIAASFIRSAEHILSIRAFLEKEGSKTPIIAKIESTQGIENFDEIVEVADGIMIARGDLGVELDLAIVPKLQKKMIRKCFQSFKPTITATQMLESMIYNPRPTRAEVSDVANAIYDGSSGIMLSAETAVGKYPVESVLQMERIARETEEDVPYRKLFAEHAEQKFPDISSSVAIAAVQTAYSANAKAIFAFTTSGKTARLLSYFSPEMPILAVTPSERVYHQLSLYWGVIPLLVPEATDAKTALAYGGAKAIEKGILSAGDIVVVTAGSPFGKEGTTNMMWVEPLKNGPACR